MRWTLWERWNGRGCSWALHDVAALERERVLLGVGRCGSAGKGEGAPGPCTMWQRWNGRGFSWALDAVGALERERVLLGDGRCGIAGTGEGAPEH